MFKILNRRLPSLIHNNSFSSSFRAITRSITTEELVNREPKTKKIKKLMCCNRGEIAIRVFRAAAELHIKTVAVYSYEDRLQIHRYKADESYMIEGKSPVQAYLNIPEIIRIAKETNCDAIHPGYGFLSENAEFAEACSKEGIIFIGPSVSNLKALGSKTEAKAIAMQCGVPVIPGTASPIEDLNEAYDFCKQYGFPVILKAAMGGGGRGMRVVRKMEDIKVEFQSCSNEAKASFGDGRIFIEKFLEKPRHIEVQILGDGKDVIHLYERDCSVQRRYQKVVEIAPAINLDTKIRDAILQDAIKIAKHVGYKNAGTVEFLVEGNDYYFIEVNPRIQVEHTVTEEMTGVDLVQAQIQIADGSTLDEIGLTQEFIHTNKRGYAIQCRVTTEDPRNNFVPDTGKLFVFRPGEGMGIRIDSASGMTGVVVTPFYDSLLSKVTGRGLTFKSATEKLIRCLMEFRVRGVKTNIPFLLNVLAHPKFLNGEIDTKFIPDHPELFEFKPGKDRGQKHLTFLGMNAVNGCSWIDPGILSTRRPQVVPQVPNIEVEKVKSGWRDIFLKEGPEAFAKAVRSRKGLLLTDTTWRDAHQSLLATRMRTIDILKIAKPTGILMPNLFSLECWGGATFDVAYRFLHECPWERLQLLREQVPNIPFQMLLRGANTVGYTTYSDNVVYKFCKVAKESGIDIFRVFDSLNYIENLKLGIDAVGEAGGIVEAAICYTGDVSDPNEKKYNLEYYLNLAHELSKLKIHILCIKDMAGLLKPKAANILISAIRKEFPNLVIHVHTHDTADTGVSSMLECAKAGADIVDVALDAMAGLTSQPALGALVATTADTPYDTGLDLNNILPINEYWEQTRMLYSTYESGQKSAGFDVFFNEIPGGQYTNLYFQCQQLGLADRWPQIKRAYSEANKLLGDIIKVTPSSKVVGDLAQFMVANKLNAEQVKQRAKDLNFPNSVVEYFKGMIGQPPGGFPEPLRTDILKGESTITGRPGANLPPYDFEKSLDYLKKKYPDEEFTEKDILSFALYPKVYEDYLDFKSKYANVSNLETKYFLYPPIAGEEVEIVLEKGKHIFIKLTAIGDLDQDSGMREVFFELNGLPRSIKIPDLKNNKKNVDREKANEEVEGSIGAPMPGMVVEIKVKEHANVSKGEPICVLSAMKMETVVRSPINGKVKRIVVKVGDVVARGDLLLEIE